MRILRILIFKLFPHALFPTNATRGSNVCHLILWRDRKPNNSHECNTCRDGSNITVAPGRVYCKTPEYFEEEIEVNPLEIFDEIILAGNQSAYLFGRQLLKKLDMG